MAKKKNTDFLNPFNEGVLYVDFLTSIPSGMTIREYCEGNLSQEEIEFIEKEISLIELNNKKTE